MYARELEYAVTHRDSGVEALITYRLMGMVLSHQKVYFEQSRVTPPSFLFPRSK